MTDEAQKTPVILNPPNLPSSISGDGRHLLTLLKRFFGEVAVNINNLNGVETEETPLEGHVATPEHFYLTFSRSGSLLQWDKIIDDKFLHYELRMNAQVGSEYGLLEKTTQLRSTKVPLSRVGKIYLYAVNNEGKYSFPNIIEYSKPIPFPPTNVAVSKTLEGVLVYFDPIPDDCIGANIYINQIKFTSPENLYLYSGNEKVAQILLAYYDVFGEGQKVEVYFEPPDVTGFYVERNDNFLDFTWDNISLYGIRFIIKRGLTWEAGEVIANDIKTNSFTLNFPSAGEHIFWIKAIDEHGNTSINPTWCTTVNVPDIQRNIILTIDQTDRQFLGAKVNMHYNEANRAIKLDDMVVRGEHIVEVELPQRYRARNWINHTMIGAPEYTITWNNANFIWDDANARTTWFGVPESAITWGDANFTWDDIEAKSTWMGDLTLEGTTLKHQIAIFTGLSSSIIESFDLNNKTTGERGTISSENTKIFYKEGRFKDGAYISDLAKLSWNISLPSVFSAYFIIRLTIGIDDDIVFMTLKGSSGRLFLGYDKTRKFFYIQDHLGNRVEASLNFKSVDYITFGIVQSLTERKLYLHSFSTNTASQGIQKIAPVGSLDSVFMYFNVN